MSHDVVSSRVQGEVSVVVMPTREGSRTTPCDPTTAEGPHCAVIMVSHAAVIMALPGDARPRRSRLGRWSPVRPFVPLRDQYREACVALGAHGRMGVIAVCIAASLASVVWRHASIPISVVGGLIVAALLCVRTGAYREYLAAIEEAHGLPSLGVVLHYNMACLRKEIKARWWR